MRGWHVAESSRTPASHPGVFVRNVCSLFVGPIGLAICRMACCVSASLFRSTAAFGRTFPRRAAAIAHRSGAWACAHAHDDGYVPYRWVGHWMSAYARAAGDNARRWWLCSRVCESVRILNASRARCSGERGVRFMDDLLARAVWEAGERAARVEQSPGQRGERERDIRTNCRVFARRAACARGGGKPHVQSPGYGYVLRKVSRHTPIPRLASAHERDYSAGQIERPAGCPRTTASAPGEKETLWT